MIIFFSGIPCAGKTVLAQALADRLDPIGLGIMETGSIVELLDGDTLRGSNFAKGIGFSKEDRDRHILRVGFLAEKLNQYVPYVICSFVAPYEEVRKQLNVDYMIYVKCPVEECIKRDVKGMYKKALNGEIKGFTGIDAPYEEPVNPDLILETDKFSIEECVDKIIELIKK